MSTNSNPIDPNLQDGFLSQHGKYIAGKANEAAQAGSLAGRFLTRMQESFALQGLVITRLKFGVRALPTRFIICSTSLMMLASFLSGSQLATLFSTYYFCLACGHRIHSMVREKRGHTQDSQDSGTPYLMGWICVWGHKVEAILVWVYRLMLKVLKPFLEPAILLAFSLFFLAIAHSERPSHVSPAQFFWGAAFSVYLALVSFAMLIQQNRSKRAEAELLLNARDSRLRNEALATLQEQEFENSPSGQAVRAYEGEAVYVGKPVN